MLCLCSDGGELPETRGAKDSVQSNNSSGAAVNGVDIPPKVTIFYPPSDLPKTDDTALLAFCRATGSEIELQAQRHTGESHDSLVSLTRAREELRERHLLSTDESGAAVFALHSSAPQNFGTQGSLRGCHLLRAAGCYARFTKAPLRSRKEKLPLPRIYYRSADELPRSRRVRSDREIRNASSDELLTIEQPITVDWSRRRLGLLPRLESGCISSDNAGSVHHLRMWMDCRITLEGRPNWLFVTLPVQCRTGAPSASTEVLRRFKEMTSQVAAADRALRFHYVTARELVNIVHAAEAGHSGDPAQFRDFRYRRAQALAAG
jgi:hypothetical protein